MAKSFSLVDDVAARTGDLLFYAGPLSCCIHIPSRACRLWLILGRGLLPLAAGCAVMPSSGLAAVFTANSDMAEARELPLSLLLRAIRSGTMLSRVQPQSQSKRHVSGRDGDYHRNFAIWPEVIAAAGKAGGRLHLYRSGVRHCHATLAGRR